MTTQQNSTTHKERLGSARCGIAEVSTWRFRQYNEIAEDDGSVSVEPKVRERTLVKLPGEGRILWLSQREVQDVLAALRQLQGALTKAPSPRTTGSRPEVMIE